MSSIGFLLSPLREIPAEHDNQWMSTVQSWLHIANYSWFGLWKQLSEEQKPGVPRMPPGTGLSSNAVDAARKKDPELLASAQPWAERAWRSWLESDRQTPPPAVDTATAHEVLSLDSRMSLQDLTGYMGGFTAVPAKKLKRGGQYGFLKNEGDLNVFGFGAHDGIQCQLFLEIARGHGGDHLAVWTFGHALHVLVARSPSPGTRPTLQGPFSVRVRTVAGASRPGGFVESLENALAGTALRPDFATLRSELAAPSLSIEACFTALGLPGARDFASPDIAARWEEMDRVAVALLTGQPADKKEVKNIKELLAPLGESARLPGKGKLGKGEIARAVSEVVADLDGGLGMPESGRWAERSRSAAFYWDITDGEAGGRLTVGTDTAGLGASASVARLLTHFPSSLTKDPVFLAMLALECEAANGHAYVEALCKLAEQIGTAGLVLVVVPAEQRPALRKALSIESDEADGANGAWCGEALVSGTTITKGDPAEAARRFVTKTRTAGAIAELSRGKGAAVTWYKEGAPVATAKDAGLGAAETAALDAAAADFLPREAFIALGAGDLLAPGAWREGSYRGDSVPGAEDHKAKKRRHVQSLMNADKESKRITSAGELLSVVGPSLRYRGPLSEQDGGIVSLRVTLPVEDPAWVRELRSDLKGRWVISAYGEAWVEGVEVRGYSCSDVDVALLTQVLGDAPAGTTITIGVGEELIGAWRIA